MSPPNQTTHDDEELIQYVLGLLPDEATEQLDEASIADDEIAARLRSVETDLVDSYVRGQLAGATLERFESYYLSSPRRRQNTRTAASFVRAIDRPTTDVALEKWANRLTRPANLARFGVAAALILLVAGMLLVRATRPSSEQTVRLGTSVAPPTKESTPASGDDQKAAAAPGPTPAAPASPSTRDIQRPSPGQIVAVALLPPTREVAPVPTLVVPADADRVRFELQLESNDFPRYRVGLKDIATGRVVWRSDWMQASADQASVSAVVPAALLRPQHYSLDLTGQVSTGREQVIGSYTVRIAEP